jgi:hypothetical protein
MGKPCREEILYNSYLLDRKARPAEVRHLSKRRKRNQAEIPIVAASEVGRAQTGSLCTSGVVGLVSYALFLF